MTTPIAHTRPRALVVVQATLLMCFVLSMWPRHVAAQNAAGSVIRGSVLDKEGRPIENADVAVEQLQRRVRSAADGRFSFVDITPGKYTLSVRSIGFESATVKVTVKDSTASVEFVLTRRPFTLPARVTTASRGGLSGVIADTGFTPLAQARVRVIGFEGEALTDTRGAFYLPVRPGRYLVHVEREGYARQIVGITIPESEGREMTAFMTPTAGKDNPQLGANLFDFRVRRIRAGPARSQMYTREDIEKFGRPDVLWLVRGAAGYPVGADCWVIVNGGPRREQLWRMSTDEVEFVELYDVPEPRVTSGPKSVSRERLAEQRLDRVTAARTGDCLVTIGVWTR
jgi:hypothetical protein